MANPREDAFKKAEEALKEAAEEASKQNREDMKEVVGEVSSELREAIEPMLADISDTVSEGNKDLIRAISKIKIDAPKMPPMPKPEITISPTFKVPAPQVTLNPTFRVPEIKVPEAQLTIPDNLKLSISNYDSKKPIPVILTGPDGEPFLGMIGGSSAPASRVIQGMDGNVPRNVAVDELGRLQMDVASITVGAVQLQDGQGSSITSHVSGDFKALDVSIMDASGNQITTFGGGTQYEDESTVIDPTGNIMMVQDSAGSLFALRGGSGIADGRTMRVVHATDVAMSVAIVSGSSSGTQYNDGATPDQAGGVGTLNMLFDGGSTQSWGGSSYGVGNVQVSSFDGSLTTVANGSLQVNVNDAFGSTAASSVFNADNRLRVSVETGGSGLTDAELRATAVPVSQVSGARWSTEATQSGTWNIGTVTIVTAVTDVTNSLKSALIDSSGVQYSGSNPVPVTVVTFPDNEPINVAQVGGVAINLGAGAVSTGTQRVVVGSDSTVMVVGDTASDVADSAVGPVKIGGIARTENPTAVAAGDRVSATYDDLGRQLTRPVQVRDLIVTAYAIVTNGTEGTLLSGSAGSFHDLIYIMAANNSGSAVRVDFRSVTAGNVVFSLEVPAAGTTGVSLPVPIPQDATGNNWTYDMEDITGTSIYISALFTREV